MHLFTRHCCHGSNSLIPRSGCCKGQGPLPAPPTNLDPALILIVLDLSQLQLATESEALERQVSDASGLQVALDLRERTQTSAARSDVEYVCTHLVMTHMGTDNTTPSEGEGDKWEEDKEEGESVNQKHT